ncbi:MAG: hypothetical protein E7190_06945 [Erysipelotrichaceae bacterium]|nr:hypothetical protein [Erysipelotrichaceae bacterium]
MLRILQIINQEYASILSCIISLITAITTIVYVVFTHHQMKATQETVKVMKDELKQNKQPCVTLSINKIESGPSLSNGRRQMVINFCVENVGDTPAISLFCISHLELQHCTDENGMKIIDMFSGPLYYSCLKIGEIKEARLHYENKQIKLLFNDLTIAMDENWKRIKSKPYSHHVRGTEIVIQAFYKNISGQWFETKLQQEVCWGYDTLTEEKTKENINEFTFPPRELTENDRFQLCLASPYLSPQLIHMVNEDEATKVLEAYKKDWPDSFRVHY